MGLDFLVRPETDCTDKDVSEKDSYELCLENRKSLTKLIFR